MFSPSPNTPPPPEGSGTVYAVNPDGNPLSLTEALDMAGPGDTISLADRLYREPIVTMKAVSTSVFGVGKENGILWCLTFPARFCQLGTL